MAVTNFTPLLGLALPTTGDLSGTWGTTVNTAITDLLDDAVAGTVTLSVQTIKRVTRLFCGLPVTALPLETLPPLRNLKPM